jgi:hypothetical protein
LQLVYFWKKKSFFSSLISSVPLNVDSDTEVDFVVALVTGILEYYAICFPFSRFFLCSSYSSSDLCKEDAKVYFLISFLESYELSSMIIRFSFLIEG